MKFEVIEALAERLSTSPITCCEYAEAGQIVRMRFAGGGHVRSASASPVADEQPTQAHQSGYDVIRAKAAGVLRFGHPCAASVERTAGETVAQGDMVAFLQVGEVLSAVTAQRAGTLGHRFLPDGALVGYGEDVMAIE